MALPVITAADFLGWNKIVANQFKEVDLDAYILRFREEYLRGIVGAAVYADIESQARQKWTDILAGVNFVDTEGKRRFLPGLTKSLISFIYFEFIRDNWTSTQVGKVKSLGENSDRATDIEVSNVARSRYNSAVRDINKTFADFLEANELFEEVVTTSTDGGDNTYTLAIASTKYLEDTDLVVISGIVYAVASVVANTSIVIDAGVTGLDFLGLTVSWEPYEDMDFCDLEIAGI
jgi:hypothetical protein